MFAVHDEQPIVAQCTPAGSGALAIVRIAGQGAIEFVSLCAQLISGKELLSCDSHTVHLGHFYDLNGTMIDQVMFIIMRAPRSFTGQDTIEITCHNNIFIIQTMIEALIARGARLAQPGEFAKRAYLNKKIDIVQAEAINEVIYAATPAALKLSLAQLEGSFSSWLVTIEQHLIKALSLAHASLEFLDEEMNFDTQIHDLIVGVQEKIAAAKVQFNSQQQIRQGIRVAIIGSVNAGKSSLFNALLNKNRAIVTCMPGTTRDTIEAGVYKDGIYWTLIDTAGLRETDNAIEQEGINRSYQEAAHADIILLVIDGSRQLTAHEAAIYQDFFANYAAKILLVNHKADMVSYQDYGIFSDAQYISCSSITRKNIDILESALLNKAQDLIKKADAPFLLNQRHYNVLMALEKQLNELTPLLTSSMANELVIYHLTQAIAQVGELTGKSISEVAVDRIFRDFCVGK